MTDPAEQNPFSETNSRSADQEVTWILWKPKVHDDVHNSLQQLHILKQTNLVHTIVP